MYERVVKRVFDILLSIVALPFVGLVTLVIAPLIFFEDRGSVFYNAPRVGKEHKVFIMYKFRTMVADAPDLKMSDGSTYNDPNDPRTTRIGTFLRKTSLDELPQVLNVLKGDMSFIGPRPDMENEVALYFLGEDRKLAVKPGISGYAQVYGRNAIAWHDRIALDIEYIGNQSFLLDTKIFFKTFSTVFAQKGVFLEDSQLTDEQHIDNKPLSNRKTAPIRLVSLAVVAYREARVIEDLFAAIVAQDYPHESIEIVLVDGLSDDGTKALMERFAGEENSFYQVKVLDNPKRVLPSGWNCAILNSSGDVIIRVDAHAYIPPEFIRKSVETIESGEAICGGVRPSILDRQSANSPWAHTLLAAEGSLFGSSIANYRKSSRARCVNSIFHGCYRREVFDTVGFFNERLVRTEDNEIHYRIRSAGFRIWLNPDIVSYQYVRPTLATMLKQKWANGFWIGRTVFICPQCLSLHHFVPFLFLLALITAGVIGFTASWIPLAVLLGLYAITDSAFSFSAVFGASRKHISLLVLPFIILTVHLAYGAGTLVGLARGLFSGRSEG